jgi:hypothetical protein
VLEDLYKADQEAWAKSLLRVGGVKGVRLVLRDISKELSELRKVNADIINVAALSMQKRDLDNMINAAALRSK